MAIVIPQQDRIEIEELDDGYVYLTQPMDGADIDQIVVHRDNLRALIDALCDIAGIPAIGKAV